MKRTFFYIGILFVIGLSSCGKNVYNERVVFPEAEWAQDNRATFDLTVSDTLSAYAFGIDMRHLENYRYSNIFVFMNTTMPNGNHTRDTIEVTLATPDGKWIGKSSGSMRDLRKILMPEMQFPLAGAYHFEIEQAMREPVLKGISDIGLYIEKQ